MFKNKMVVVATMTGGMFYGKLIKHKRKTNAATIKKARRIVLSNESIEFTSPMVKNITVQHVIDIFEPSKKLKELSKYHDTVLISSLLDCEVS